MRFNIISNLANGVGLERDYQTLRHELERRGHVVQGVQFNAKPFAIYPADVNIFDEVVNPAAFTAAPVQWVSPHPEWWFTGWEQYRFDKVLAKTRDCERIFRAKVGKRCQYLGWKPRDMYLAGIPKERKFLHVCGKSQMKNTLEVVHGCKQAGVPLIVIGQHPRLPQRRVTDRELMILMNTCFCQVMPSAYEGYGHVLHEARSASQVIITTDAPPMNELVPSVLVPSSGTSKHHEGTLHTVTPQAIAKAVREVLSLPPEALKWLQEQARSAFEKEVAAFDQALTELVGVVDEPSHSA